MPDTQPQHETQAEAIEAEAIHAEALTTLHKLELESCDTFYPSILVNKSELYLLLRELATFRRAAAQPVDDTRIREIEARAKKAWKQFVDDNFHVATGSALADINTLLAALRSRAGESGGERWIPCSERMPGDDDVLSFSCGLFAVASWHADKQLWDIGEGWCASVSHWMPLPDPPKAVPNG